MNNSILSIFLLFSLIASSIHARENCIELTECLALVIGELESNIEYEQEMIGSGLIGEIQVLMNQDFSISSVDLVKSSGNANFDRVIVKGFKRANSFDYLSGLSLSDQERVRDLVIRVSAPDENET